MHHPTTSDRFLHAAVALRSELLVTVPSKALRTIAGRFNLRRSELGFLAADVYENILTPEVQAVWHWDLDESGKGHTDKELDQLLAHLVLCASQIAT
jgi:hypothetical protein